MPNPFIKAVAKQSNEKKATVEKEYKQQEELAKKRGVTNPYAYATAVVEKMHPAYHPKGKK